MINDTLAFTCRDLLLIPNLQGAIVLAGHKGMDRAVNRVNVMEVPDVIDWVRPGEFLVTSGFPFRDDPDRIAEMIPQLAERGVAALGIKTRRYIEEIPVAVLEMANQYDIPIIELPLPTSFSDVVREVMERVLVQEARHLTLLQFRYQKLSKKLLHGGGIDDFLGELDETLLNPVVLMDGSNQLYFSPMAKELFPGNEDSQEWARLCHDIELGVSFMTVRERRIRVYISNEDGKDNECSMLLLEWNRELDDADKLTMDRIGVLVSLELANLHARREVESKYVDQFLQDWLTGRIVTRQDIQARADACGCRIAREGAYSAIYVKLPDRHANPKLLSKAIKQFRRFSTERDGIWGTQLDGHMALLISHETAEQLNQQLDKCLYRLSHLLGLESKAEISFCIGDPVDAADEVRRSCEQARKIHFISSICGIRDAHIRYNQLGVYQLLYLLPESEQVIEFLDRIVKPIVDYDGKHNTQLLKTLQCYLQHNENGKLTAEALFSHYNTVAYRIERVYELLGLDPEKVNDRLQLHLAVKLYEMRQGR
ncbi:PucR family transcriptional regulator [Cohnella hashimotonis]|uniref:PucR family transcriptional regulator ligand-binding domain-containing protein n=1 Tax=Cohnella hashimotonis TaxID=2826895 RepID=A0ABT6THT9_9BACL|nr:PucR family transcriptional regulator [Cohnella hashimotonis]MDI4645880.1 PucR family transcriptional regulator ligand-binding domain-containing protein [Cohnella hashimotonis]